MRLAPLMRVMVGSLLLVGLMSVSGAVAATKSATPTPQDKGKKQVAMVPKKAMKQLHHDKQMTLESVPVDAYWESVYREQREPNGGQ